MSPEPQFDHIPRHVQGLTFHKHWKSLVTMSVITVEKPKEMMTAMETLTGVREPLMNV